MPGNANAAERGWLRALIVGLVLAHTLAPARDAAGGQSQSRIPVSAYVVVSSTITATVSTAIAPTPASPPPAAPSADAASQGPQTTPAKPQQICTEVAVSCSGRAPMRVGIAGESSGEVQECSARAQSTVSLCAPGANGPQGSLGLTIEY